MKNSLFRLVCTAAALVLSFASVNAQAVEPTDVSLDSLLQIPITAAAKHWQTIEEAPASVSIITSSQIERFGYRTMEELLMSVRGFYVSNDRNYTYVGVRGFSRPTDYNNRLLLLVNGHTMNENVYGSSALGTDLALPLGIIDRVEIVRGPGSSLYGTSAMFAVINIVTKKGITLDGFVVAAAAGTNKLYEGSLLWGKEYDSGLDILFAAHITDSKGEELYFSEFDTDSTNGGVAQDLDWDRYSSLFLTLSYRTLKLQAVATTREKGIPTASYETVFNDPSARTLDQRQMVELQWNPPLGSDKEFSVRGYFDRYFYEGTYPYDAPQYDGSSGIWVGTELQFHWDVAPNNRITLGTEYQRHLEADYLLEYQGETLFSRDFPYSIGSLYVQDEYQPTENLSLTAGLRYDSYSTFGNTVNPRGAVIYNPAKGSTLKLLYGTAFRAPNVYEVYFEDPISGLKPNLNLKPETIQTAEAVWEQRLSDDVYGILSLYDYRMKNLIDQQIDEADSLTSFQNVNKVKAQGLELELNFRLSNDVRGYLSYTLQKAEDAVTEVELTNSPQHLAKAGIGFPAFRLLDLGVELLYECERTTVYDTRTDAFLLTNLNVRTQPLFDHLRFSVLVRNIFDVQYKLPGGLEHVQNAIPQRGRTFVVKAEVKL